MPSDRRTTAVALREAGFGWVTLNATGVFLAGARQVEAMLEALEGLHRKVRAEVGTA